MRSSVIMSACVLALAAFGCASTTTATPPGATPLASEATATVEDGWIAVDGARLWKAPEDVRWIRATRDADRVAVAVIAKDDLRVGVAGRGTLYGPLVKVGRLAAPEWRLPPP